MTPKEKAEELVDKFSKPIDGLHKYPMCFDTSKQCALICADEMLKTVRYLNYENPKTYFEDKKFWFEVKQEIEKL